MHVPAINKFVFIGWSNLVGRDGTLDLRIFCERAVLR